jgi:hypothetical protein
MLQAQLQVLATQTQTQQAQILEMERREAQRVADSQRLQDVLLFVATLQNVPGVVVPPSLLAQAVPPSVGTPVSILLFIPLAFEAILQLLMNSLLLCAATVLWFEPDS